MNTAQLRAKAADAARNLQWELAADLYEQALAAYPKHHAGNQCALHDKAAIEAKAKQCRSMCDWEAVEAAERDADELAYAAAEY